MNRAGNETDGTSCECVIICFSFFLFLTLLLGKSVTKERGRGDKGGRTARTQEAGSWRKGPLGRETLKTLSPQIDKQETLEVG